MPSYVKGQYLQENMEYKLPGTGKGTSGALANRTAEKPLVLLHFSKMQNGQKKKTFPI